MALFIEYSPAVQEVPGVFRRLRPWRDGERRRRSCGELSRRLFILFILCSTCSCIFRYWWTSVPMFAFLYSRCFIKYRKSYTRTNLSIRYSTEREHLLFVQNLLNICKISYSRDEIEKRIGEYEIVLSDLECRQVSYLTFFGLKKTTFKVVLTCLPYTV